MKVSVVVPVYNEEKYIADCLQALYNQEEPADEIIIVDNNSTDASIRIAQKYPVVVVRESHQGMIYARNKGFDTARFAIVARTDADTHVPKDWIKNIKQRFAADSKLVAFSGPAYFYGVPDMLQHDTWQMRLFYESFRQLCGHECLLGPNMAIRRQTWKKVKKDVCLVDSKVHEDVDLALHIAYYGNISFDYHHLVFSSPRRWKKIKPYVEYPLRYLKTIKQHYHSIAAVKKSKKIIKTVIPKTSTIIKHMRQKF